MIRMTEYTKPISLNIPEGLIKYFISTDALHHIFYGTLDRETSILHVSRIFQHSEAALCYWRMKNEPKGCCWNGEKIIALR